MKALIASGGRGTRLRPITHTQNKQLIPIANKPILFYAIEAIRDAGITDVGIVINRGDTEVPSAVGNGSAWGLRTTYIEQAGPLGVAHVVKIARDFLGDEPFVFYLGDNMIVGGITRFIDEFEQRKSHCHLTLARVKNPRPFGVPDLRDGKIIRIEEKPAHPKSPYAVAGLYLYTNCIFEAVNQLVPSARGELEISDAHQYLLDHDYRVTYSEITGWWMDTGKSPDLLAANRLVLENLPPRIEGEVDDESTIAGRVIIEPGARIINSNIRGPAIIGAGTIIENSYIGPFTSIHDSCHIRNSEVEYSIVMQRAKILDVTIRIESSILGNEAEIIRANGKPRTHRFIIGDQSRVDVA